MPSVTFYFDVGSPFAYLAASRLDEVLGADVAWQPVSLGALFKLTGRSSWALGDYRRRQAGMADIERRARSYGLPPMRWPDPWPTDYLTAMRAVTYAFGVGRGRELAMHAFRSAFQRGRQLRDPAEVFAVAAEVGLGRRELEAGVADPQIKWALRDATD